MSKMQSSRINTDTEWSDAEERSAHRAVLFKRKVDAGAAACARGDFSAALRMYQEAIRLDPSNHVLYSNRSAILCKIGRYEEAYEDANKAFQLKPTWTKIIDEFVKVVHYDEMVGTYIFDTTQDKSGGGEAFYRKGQSLKCMGDYVRALQAYASGLAQESKNAQLLSGLIECAMCSPLKSRLEPILDELGGLGLERSPFVLISVIGQELLNSGHTHEAVEILECALKVGTTSLKLRQSVLSSLSSAYWSLGNLEKALNCMKQDLAVAASLGDTPGECRAHANLGMVYLSMRRQEEALDHYRHQLALTLKMNDQRSAAMVLSTVGGLYTQLMDFNNAMASFEQALEILNSLKSFDPDDGSLNIEIGKQYSGMGNVYAAQGNIERSDACYREYLSICRNEGNQSDEAQALALIGGVQMTCKQLADCTATLLSALKCARSAKDRKTEGNICGQLANLSQTMGHWQQSKKWAEKQLAIALSVKDKSMEGSACGYLGCVFQNNQNYENANRLHAKHLQLAEQAGDAPGLLIAHRNLGICYAALKQWEASLKEHKAELGLAHALCDISSEGLAHGSLAIVQSKLGHRTQALTNLQCRWQLAKDRSDMEAQAAALCCIGEFYLQEGDLAKAVEHLEKYLMLAQEQNDVQAERTACRQLGTAHMELGKTKEAARYFDQELSLAKDCRDHTGMAHAYRSLGEAHFALNQLDEALECQKYFLALAHITTDINAKLKAMSQIGQVLLMKNRTAAATKVLAKGLNLAHASKNQTSTADFYGLLGKAYDQAGKLDKALAFYSQELMISNQTNDKKGQYKAFGRIGEHYLKSKKITLCVKAFEDQAKIGQDLKDIDLEAEALGRIGMACAQNHLHQDALSSFGEALRILKTSKSMHCKHQSLLFKTSQQLAQGQEVLGQLISAVNTQMEIMIMFKNDPSLINHPLKTHCGLLLKRGQLWLRIGNCEKSIDLLHQCMNLMDSGSTEEGYTVDPVQKAAVLKLLATAYCALGDFATAEKMVQHRLHYVHSIGLIFEENKCFMDLACALRLKGDVDQCLQLLHRQIQSASPGGKGGSATDPFLYCHLLYQLGLTDEVRTNLEGAKSNYSAILDQLNNIGPKLTSVELNIKALRSLGFIHLSLGQVSESLALLEKAVGIAASHSLQHIEAEIRLGMALAHWITNDSKQFLQESEIAARLAEKSSTALIWGNPSETGPTDPLVCVILFLRMVHLCSQRNFEDSLFCAEKLAMWKMIFNSENCGLDMRQKCLEKISRSSVLNELKNIHKSNETFVRLAPFNAQSVAVWVSSDSDSQIFLVQLREPCSEFPCCPYPSLQLVMESCSDTIDCDPIPSGSISSVLAKVLSSSGFSSPTKLCIHSPIELFPSLTNLEHDLETINPGTRFAIRYISSLVSSNNDAANAFDPFILPALTCFSGVAEADPEIANIFGVSPVFSGTLSKADLLDRMQKASVVHLALEISPDREGMILRCDKSIDDQIDDPISDDLSPSTSPSPSNKPDRTITPADLMKLTLQASVVVLVPVQTTMANRCDISSLMLSMGQAMLIAGARAVLFSRKPLRDPVDCPQFFRKFHSNLKLEKFTVEKAFQVSAGLHKEDGVEELVLFGDGSTSLVYAGPQQSAILGQSLRMLLKTPDECREALRVILHLVEKSLQRINVAQDTPMYTNEISVRNKVGPEVKGWLEFLQAVGFHREPNCSGSTAISNMQIKPDDYSLYFPKTDSTGLLSKASELLQALLGLPQTSLLAFAKLLGKDTAIVNIAKKLTNLSISLENTTSNTFETSLPTQLYKIDGVHNLLASLGFDKMKEDSGEIFLKTIRMELTKRMVLYATTCMKMIFDGTLTNLNLSGASSSNESISEMVTKLSCTSIAAGTFLQKELNKLKIKPEVTDFSCLESDFCPTDVESSKPLRLVSEKPSDTIVGQSGYKSDIEPSLEVPHGNNRAMMLKSRKLRGYKSSGKCSNGYASESEAKVNKSKGLVKLQVINRGYFSEDEFSAKNNKKLHAMEESCAILQEDTLETTAQVLSVDDPADSGNEEDGNPNVPTEPYGTDLMSSNPLNISNQSHEYFRLETPNPFTSSVSHHPNDPAPKYPTSQVSTFVPNGTVKQPITNMTMNGPMTNNIASVRPMYPHKPRMMVIGQDKVMRTLSHSPGPPSVCAPSPPLSTYNSSQSSANSMHFPPQQPPMIASSDDADLLRSAAKKMLSPAKRPNIGHQPQQKILTTFVGNGMNRVNNDTRTNIYSNGMLIQNKPALMTKPVVLQPKHFQNENGFVTREDSLPASLI